MTLGARTPAMPNIGGRTQGGGCGMARGGEVQFGESRWIAGSGLARRRLVRSAQ